jgi:hypothetical protein
LYSYVSENGARNFVTGKIAKNTWKRLEDNIVAELDKINAYINLEILVVLPGRTDSCLNCFLL